MSIKYTSQGLPTVNYNKRGDHFQQLQTLILVNDSWEIGVNCVDQSDIWLSGVQNDNVLFLPPAFRQTWAGKEATYAEANWKVLTGSRTQEYLLDYEVPFSTGQSLRDIKGDWRVILIDKMGNYLAQKVAKGADFVYKGIKAKITYEQLNLAADDSNCTIWQFRVVIPTPSDVENATAFKPSFTIPDPLKLAKLVIDEASVTLAKIDLKVLNAYDEAEFVSLMAGQKFEVLDNTGKAVTATFTDKGSGNYTLAFTSTAPILSVSLTKPYISGYKSWKSTIASGVSACTPYEYKTFEAPALSK